MPSNKQQGAENTFTPETFDSLLESLTQDAILPAEFFDLYTDTITPPSPLADAINKTHANPYDNNNNNQQIDSPFLSSVDDTQLAPADDHTNETQPHAWFAKKRRAKDTALKTTSQALSRYKNIYILLTSDKGNKSDVYSNPTIITEPDVIKKLDVLPSNALRYNGNVVTTHKQFKMKFSFTCLNAKTQEIYTPTPKAYELIRYCEETKNIYYNNDLIIEVKRAHDYRNENKKNSTRLSSNRSRATLFQPATPQLNRPIASANTLVTTDDFKTVTQMDEQAKHLQMQLCDLDPHQASAEIKQMLWHVHTLRVLHQEYKEKKAKLMHPSMSN